MENLLMAELQSQEAVNYRTAEDGMQSCSNCQNFRAPDQCGLVQGPIGASGVCDLWVKMNDSQAVADMLFGPPGMAAPNGAPPGTEGMAM